MPYQPYTTRLIGPTSITIVYTMGISQLSLIGKTATVSTALASNAVPGLPAASAVDIAQGQTINLIGANGGPVEHITINVPAGGQVDVIANRY